MGGEVTVNSVPGESSTFTIKIPAIVRELEHIDPNSGGSVSVTSDGEVVTLVGSSVLVIDDDPTQRDLMCRFLVGEGFSVQTASDGAEGLQLARRLLPIAITLDVMMPGMDGWTVLSSLKADPLLCNIPVIMLTMVDDRKRAYSLGATHFMTKPVDRKGLAEMLKKYRCPHPPCPVLLVGNDAATNGLMRSMLERAGWAASEAENGRTALERIAENLPALILLDLTMPETEGIEFVTQLEEREAWSSIPVVVLTSNAVSAKKMHRLGGNVHTVLEKVGRPREELMRQVRDLLVDWTLPATP